MKEKFDRSKAHKNIGELAQETYEKKIADMTKEEIEKYNNYLQDHITQLLTIPQEYQKEEIIDGVRVVSTGMYEFKGNPIENVLNHQPNFVNDIMFYDENGNEFVSNYSNVETAQQWVLKLAEEGKNAVIGPPAPYISEDNKFISLKDTGMVGLYIVKKLEKEQKPSMNK